MKHILLIIALVASVLTVKAQDIAPLLTAMPDSFMPQLETAWRKDLVDLFKAGKSAKLENTMNGYSELKALTADYVHLQVTAASEVQLKLLPLVNNTYIICMINTVSGPVKDSRTSFYTTEWKPLDSKSLFTPPTLEQFIAKGVNQTDEASQAALATVDMLLLEYCLNASNFQLEATLTTPQYVSKEQREALKKVINEAPIVYKWNNSRFELL
jgi:hypothetical protein